MNHHPSARRAGLAVLGLVSLGDVATLALTDGDTPPYPVAILGAALGVLCLYLVARAPQDPAYPVRLLVGLRILSALAALPAFVADDVPVAAEAAAAAFVVLTAVGVVLLARTRASLVTA